jgi:hypothetical protein
VYPRHQSPGRTRALTLATTSTRVRARAHTHTHTHTHTHSHRRTYSPPSSPLHKRTHANTTTTTTDTSRYVAQTDTVAVITFTDLAHQGSHPGMADPVVPPCALEAEPYVPDDRDPAEVYVEHLFGAGRFSSAAIERALNLYDKRAFQLYKLSRLVAAVDASVLGCSSSQMVCAGGAALAVDPAVGFGDVWMTLTAGLELRLLTTTHLYDGGGAGGPELLVAASDPLPFELYTGGAGFHVQPAAAPTREFTR